MPQQMEVLPFNNPNNIDLLDGIRSAMSNQYQSRIPAATKAGLDATMNALWNFAPGRNEFVDALVNVIGAQIMHFNTWNNPLAKYKRGMLAMGETIEEVAIGLAKAKQYSQHRGGLEQDIFGIERPEIQSRFHKINREDWYKVSVNRRELQKAFYNENGLSGFVQGLMSTITTSDQVDEFLLMASLFRQYYDHDGFYKVQVPDLTNVGVNSDQAKQFLVTVRELSRRLQFMSTLYNPAHMPRVTQPNELELILTPRAEAVVDVEGLAGLFNVSKAEINARTTIVPEENLNIPGAMGILTTREFFVSADTVLEMQNSNNPVMLHQNYFWHHWGVISASPFAPAILLTTENATETIVVRTPVDGISDITLVDETGATVTSVTRGGTYLVQASATTNPAGGDNDAVILTVSGAGSQYTRVSQTGILIVGLDDSSTSLTVTATASDDQSFTKDLVVPVTGSLVNAGLGLSVDNNVSTISNTGAPALTPASGASGTVFSVDNGKWDTTRLTFSYVWLANGTPISGATANTYTAQAGDAGKTLTVQVTAAKSGLTSGTAVSNGATVTS